MCFAIKETNSIHFCAEFERSVALALKSDAFFNASNEMIRLTWKNKPFYAPNVLVELDKLNNLIKSELIELKYGDKTGVEYIKNNEKNTKEFIILMEIVCKAIRDRIGVINISN